MPVIAPTHAEIAVPALHAAADTAARPRDRNVRWLIIGITLAPTIAKYLDHGNISVAGPLIMKCLGISARMMGVIISAFVWPYAIMNLLTGWLMDWFGAKILLAFSASL